VRLLHAAFLMAFYASTTWADDGNSPINGRTIRQGDTAWTSCTQLSADPGARLACFDHWARQQGQLEPQGQQVPHTPVNSTAPDAIPTVAATPIDCRNGEHSELSRFWELEADSDCGRFNLRSYRPISLSLIASDSVNTAPDSSSPGHTASYQPYLTSEERIQLSVRVKIGQGLLHNPSSNARDSLWFAYSQQSYWQFFTSSISRPFRSTDHEPELIYILPTDAPLPLGWRLRYSGISLNHQSNGQSLPLSRSWNRIIFMAGMEKDKQFTLNGRFWQRIPEDASEDDNPEISDTVGRAELAGTWNMSKDSSLGLTVRHSLRGQANGSYRLEWLKTLGDSGQSHRDSGLRFHVQLFSGYGDSLVDYNRQRTVLSVGLSLVDW
jgi:phospholipase A1/A2